MGPEAVPLPEGRVGSAPGAHDCIVNCCVLKEMTPLPAESP